MIRTDGIPTIAFANLKHVTEAEIEEDMVEEYIDYLLAENGVHIESDYHGVIPPYDLPPDDEDNIWDEPWAENDWLYEQDKPRDLVWDTEPEGGENSC